MSTVHIPVLLKETIEALSPKVGDVFVDATLGGGGHTEALLGHEGVSVIAFDADEKALERSKERLKKYGSRVSFVHSNFRHIAREVEALGFKEITGALFDLGLSSDELEQSGRGFSFKGDEPLHMGFDPKQSLTAEDLLAHLSREALATIIKVYGEERFSWKIAGAIVEARELKAIQTTAQLREIIESAVPKSYARGRVHPATKTFQALRIAVNDEYDAEKEGLAGAWKLLKAGGRLAVISFHSGEDRIAKVFMREKEDAKEGERAFKKPVKAGPEELHINTRARSAKLRVLIKNT